VRGLKINAKLTLVQAQNAAKLENAKLAIGILKEWIGVPEADKTAMRPAFIQAISSLGFRNAESIVRQAAVDPAGLLQIVPPELQPLIQNALVTGGYIAPATPGKSQLPAPVMSPKK